MKFSVLRPGTECADKATELPGTVTHWVMGMDKHILYLFQPRGLTDEGQPTRMLYLCAARLTATVEDHETVEVPFEILGSQVEDRASGFKGMAIQFIRHTNGCFHVEIQPPGLVAGKGAPIQAHDFDLRMCIGEKIPMLTSTQLQESRRATPSPSERPELHAPGNLT